MGARLPRWPRWFDANHAIKAFDLDIPGYTPEIKFTRTEDSVTIESWHMSHGDPDDFGLALLRSIKPDDSGRLAAFHDVFILASLLQGRGHAKQMMKSCVPYYWRRAGIRTIYILDAQGNGRKVWPRFGFTLMRQCHMDYIDAVRDIAAMRSGEYIPLSDIPLGVNFHEFDSPGVSGLALLALQRMSRVQYFLDLRDSNVLQCLHSRGIKR